MPIFPINSKHSIITKTVKNSSVQGFSWVEKRGCIRIAFVKPAPVDQLDADTWRPGIPPYRTREASARQRVECAAGDFL